MLVKIALFDSAEDVMPGFTLGVGLALAKRHIEAIKGEVSAKNNPNGGLEFTIILPFYEQSRD